MIIKENGKLNGYGFQLAKIIYMCLLDRSEALIITYAERKDTNNKVKIEDDDDDDGYKAVCDYFDLDYTFIFEECFHYIRIKRDLRKRFYKEMKLTLSAEPKQKQRNDCKIEEYKNDVVKAISTKDISMKEITRFINRFNETQKLFLLRKKYDIDFEGARIILKGVSIDQIRKE
ncbi:MAG: hypothetical protein RSC93_07305 [Erysipelotrichaceae bacterium]